MTRSIGAVITSFNQGQVLPDAVRNALGQTQSFDQIVVVDDGSTEAGALDGVSSLMGVEIIRTPNGGVSSARNVGVAAAGTDLVAILDGDDAWEPTFVEKTVMRLADPDVVGASSWLRTTGLTEWVVRPSGGDLRAFLARNNCPASVVFERSSWDRCGGYDETMREGFEDWDFSLRLLANGGRIAIVEEPLIAYRTAPESSNVLSMDRRLELFQGIIERHEESFRANFARALLELEATSKSRLDRIEQLLKADPHQPIGEVSFGDGGLAAAVRVATARGRQGT